MKIAPKNLSISLLAGLATFFTYAAPPGGGPPPPTPPPPPGLPIDGSILLLAFVAMAYGFYSLRKFKLQSK
ncbi:PID-CTERM protein-sorting domain-containing protein [Flavobacterium sp.]|uniref:PID-CTERM protein-sorting domain-containing protein n=1 Tax=Flavobacterium sp. TaxID=239 RepID=UPI0037509D61